MLSLLPCPRPLLSPSRKHDDAFSTSTFICFGRVRGRAQPVACVGACLQCWQDEARSRRTLRQLDWCDIGATFPALVPSSPAC